MRFDIKSKPRRVAHRAPDTRGVVNETPVMQNTDDPGIEVSQSAVEINKLTVMDSVEGDRHGINGKIAAAEVVSQGTGRYSGKRPGTGINLFARPGDVDANPVGELNLGRTELREKGSPAFVFR